MRRLLSVVAFVGLVVPSAFAAPGDQDDEKGKDRPKDAGKPDEGKGGGKGDEKSGQEGRLADIDKKIQGEIDKHAGRVAKIDRLAELLESKKDDKAKADLTHMREQEDARHKNAMRVLSEHRARIVEGKDADEKGKPGHEGGEKAKEKGKDKDKDDEKSKGKGDEGKGDSKGQGDAKGKDKEKDQEKEKEKEKGKDDGGDKGKDKDDGKDNGKDKKDDKGGGKDKGGK